MIGSSRETALRHGPRLAKDAFLALAAAGHRVPIGTDLLLHEQPDPEGVLLDGARLASVVLAAAARYQTPLAIPLMDLRLEKADLLARLRPGAPPDDLTFAEPPAADDLERARDTADAPFAPRQRAQLDAIAGAAARPDVLPMGMAIGPFSLLTRLLRDPIGAVALAGGGVSAEEEPLVAAAERCLDLARGAVRRWTCAQLAAGAAAVIVCEPAVSTSYLSPRQIADGSSFFDRFVIEPLLEVKHSLEARGALLFLHDCGELTEAMVAALASCIRPAVLSLGSSRRLWEDAGLVPADVVLYGNLPTRHFHLDVTLPIERLRALTRELVVRMREAGRPFILGSECDVLHVPDAADTIRRKVDAMLAEEA